MVGAMVVMLVVVMVMMLVMVLAAWGGPVVHIRHKL